MKRFVTLIYLCVVPFLVFGNEEKINTKEILIEEMNKLPQCVYKILSLRDWHAFQNSQSDQLFTKDNIFIHFSNEDLLESFIGKYQTETTQMVLLKIESNKLKGSLVFETNAGRICEYYRLNEGFIPMNSIIESKIINFQSFDSGNNQKAEIIQVGNPILRQRARELSIEEIKSSEIQNLIEIMKATLRAESGVGLAAPQIGKSLQIIVIEDMNHSHLNANQLAERNRYPVPLHVIINPRIYLMNSADRLEFFEGCLSVPGLVGIVPRAESVYVECLNELGEPVIIHAKGWYARILQHEIDHLYGILYIDKAQLPSLMTIENYVNFYKDKSIKEIQNGLFGFMEEGIEGQ